MPQYQVEIKCKFEFAHRLMDYVGKCNNVHGHTGWATVTFAGDSLDSTGMVIDFGDIKRVVREWVDARWDHSYICRQDDPLGDVFRDEGLSVYGMVVNPTTENLCEHLYHVVDNLIEPKCVGVEIQETPVNIARYEP